MGSDELKYGRSALGRIHAKSNRRKAETYWLGFLEGVLASESIESLEVASIRAEAEQFLQLLATPTPPTLSRTWTPRMVITLGRFSTSSPESSTIA